jgi:translation initiation factor IF-2
MVTDGTIRRNGKVNVVRHGKTIASKLTVANLKRMQEDAREVRNGFECGIALDKFNEYQEGGVLEFYVEERVP